MATAIVIGSNVVRERSVWVWTTKMLRRWLKRRSIDARHIVDIAGLEEAVIRIGIANM